MEFALGDIENLGLGPRHVPCYITVALVDIVNSKYSSHQAGTHSVHPLHSSEEIVAVHDALKQLEKRIDTYFQYTLFILGAYHRLPVALN